MNPVIPREWAINAIAELGLDPERVHRVTIALDKVWVVYPDDLIYSFEIVED